MIRKSEMYWQESVYDIWDLYAPPVRPSKSELKVWEQKKTKKKRAKTLILGSTPELRDLAHKLNHEVYTVDMSIKMTIEMHKLMKYKNREEVNIRANWLNAPLKKDFFDFIIGDFVLENIPFHLQDLFFKKQHELLKKGGFFIHRHPFVINKISIKKTVDYFLTLKDINKQQWNELAVDLLFSSYNKDDFTFSTTKTRENIKKFKNKNKRIRKLFNMFNKIYPNEKTWWATPPNKAEEMMKKYFKIENIEYGNDHRFVNQTPIYVLKK